MNRSKRFFSRWQNWIGVLLILGYVGVAVLAPVLSPNDPKNPGPFLQVGKRTRTLGEPQPPNERAPLGMLPFGVDVYHALVWGSRGALLFGLVVTVSTALFGVLYGAISGFAGNRLGGLMLRVADSFLAFPPIAGVVLLQQLFMASVSSLGGYFLPTGEILSFDKPIPVTLIQILLERFDPLMLSLIVFSWMPYARLVHSIVLTLKEAEFVQAAHALGGGPFWIIRKHLLHNSIGPAIVLAARDVGGVVLLQATLTFIGIGGGSIWGEMLSQGRNWVIGPGGSLLRYWWVFLPPTFAVMLFGIAWNMLGDSLNDVLDPTSHHAFPGRSFWRRKKKEQTGPLPAEETLPGPASDIQPAETSFAVEPVEKSTHPNGTDPVLRTARESVARGDLPQALHAYSHLIRRNRLIGDVLPDLAQLVKTFGRDPQVWQTLGDALARTGDPRHADQSYEQARKLRQG
jgi:peptide/nickel transport system permease protein